MAQAEQCICYPTNTHHPINRMDGCIVLTDRQHTDILSYKDSSTLSTFFKSKLESKFLKTSYLFHQL